MFLFRNMLYCACAKKNTSGQETFVDVFVQFYWKQQKCRNVSFLLLFPSCLQQIFYIFLHFCLPFTCLNVSLTNFQDLLTWLHHFALSLTFFFFLSLSLTILTSLWTEQWEKKIGNQREKTRKSEELFSCTLSTHKGSKTRHDLTFFLFSLHLRI